MDIGRVRVCSLLHRFEGTLWYILVRPFHRIHRASTRIVTSISCLCHCNGLFILQLFCRFASSRFRARLQGLKEACWYD